MRPFNELLAEGTSYEYDAYKHAKRNVFNQDSFVNGAADTLEKRTELMKEYIFFRAIKEEHFNPRKENGMSFLKQLYEKLNTNGSQLDMIAKVISAENNDADRQKELGSAYFKDVVYGWRKKDHINPTDDEIDNYLETIIKAKSVKAAQEARLKSGEAVPTREAVPKNSFLNSEMLSDHIEKNREVITTGETASIFQKQFDGMNAAVAESFDKLLSDDRKRMADLKKRIDELEKNSRMAEYNKKGLSAEEIREKEREREQKKLSREEIIEKAKKLNLKTPSDEYNRLVGAVTDYKRARDNGGSPKKVIQSMDNLRICAGEYQASHKGLFKAVGPTGRMRFNAADTIAKAMCADNILRLTQKFKATYGTDISRSDKAPLSEMQLDARSKYESFMQKHQAMRDLNNDFTRMTEDMRADNRRIKFAMGKLTEETRRNIAARTIAYEFICEKAKNMVKDKSPAELGKISDDVRTLFTKQNVNDVAKQIKNKREFSLMMDNPQNKQLRDDCMYILRGFVKGNVIKIKTKAEKRKESLENNPLNKGFIQKDKIKGMK